MRIDQFNKILNQTSYDQELKKNLLEFFDLLNNKGQDYLIENLSSIINSK